MDITRQCPGPQIIFLIKSVCVLVIYKRLALIFSRSCALSDDILIFHKHWIRWGGGLCICFSNIALHPCNPSISFPPPPSSTIPSFLHLTCLFFVFFVPLWLRPSLNCCPICAPPSSSHPSGITLNKNVAVGTCVIVLFFFFGVVVLGHIMQPLRALARGSPGFVTSDSTK